ncbi:MAG TPA: TonB-dependent receptor [Pedobacter sp.]|uniref:TonB-dependent receptor n=1 Tax=Pedobacter sp. TaxID=1411316 RepID=UPI002CFF691E|nr:TonB-dependent receptor [Pedobacter sp.]HMI02479.1 TonB-dependent receptor [Pedobacter sp.]
MTRATFMVIVISLTLSSILLAKEVKSQRLDQISVSVNTNKATLHEVLTVLSRQSDLNFVYSEDLGKMSAMDLKINHITLDNVLKKLADRHRLRFEQINGSIAVSKLPAVKINRILSLKGVVSDATTGETLIGVSVLVKDSKSGTVTDQNGAFSLRSDLSSGTLLFYYVGYEKLEYNFDAAHLEFTVKMKPALNSLSTVTIEATRRALQPVQHTGEREMLQEIKQAGSVVSGISSELIAKMPDVNAAQVARRISGVTLTDEQFLVVRGMNQRYNITYLGDNIAPSTEQYSRAFAMNLLPSRIIDKIMVYKSPRADLFGDFAGAAVKVYTKDALAVKHFDVGLRIGYLSGGTFDQQNTYKGGKLDWLGIEDGTRALPSSVAGYGDFSKANLTQKEYVKSFSPTLGLQTKTALPDMQLTANYYDSFKLGKARLYNITGLSYTNEIRGFDVYRQTNNLYSSYSDYISSTVSNEAQSSEEVTLNLMLNFMLRLNEHHKIYFKNFLLQQGRKGTIDRIQRPNAYPDSLGRYGYQAEYWKRNIVLDYRERFLYSGNFGGTHDLDSKQNLNWNLGFTGIKNETPDQRISRFVNSDYPFSNFNLGESKDFDLNWRADDRYGKVPGNYDRDGTAARVFTRLSEQVYNSSLDYSIAVRPWLEMKAGTYQLFKQRDLARRLFTVYDGELSEGNRSNLIGSLGEGLYYKLPGSLQYVDPSLWRFNLQDLSKVWGDDYFREDGSGLRVEDRTGPMDAYKASEQYNSGYFMATAKPFGGKVELNGGLRLEYDQVKLAAVIPSQVLPDQRYGPSILINRSRLSWLPSANAAWHPSESWVLRGAYGKTVNRPEFREISPFRDFDYPNNQMINGNPALVQSDISSYDLRLELYPKNNKGEMVSIGAFYKQLKNPIERIIFSANIAAAEINGFDNISFTNVDKATVQGIEVDVRKSLNFIPGKLFRNFSILFNASLIRSHVNGAFIAAIPGSGSVFIDTAFNRPLQGQAPYVINAGLFYDNAKLGSKFSLNYSVSGTSIYAVGKYSNPANVNVKYRGSVLELARHLLDFSYTQQFARRWQAKLSINNLLDEDIRFAEDQNRDNKYQPEQDTGKTNAAAGRTSPVYSGDNISRQWSPGRNLQANLIYSF